MTSLNNNVSDQEAQHSCFQEWMKLQQEDLLELLHNSSISSSSSSTSNTSPSSDSLPTLHFQDYINTRRHLECSNVTAYLAPTGCTTLESSMLWISGCRPSSLIQVLYAMIGKEFESHLSNYLQVNRSRHLSGLLSVQLNSVDELQRKTIRQEDQLSKKLASLQEEIADQPFAIIAHEVGNLGEMYHEAEEALDRHAKCLMNVVEEADKLGMETLKELVMKLHLCINAWGKTRDHQHGRNKETTEETNTSPTLSWLEN